MGVSDLPQLMLVKNWSPGISIYIMNSSVNQNCPPDQSILESTLYLDAI